MSFRYRDIERPSGGMLLLAVGAVAGIAAGVVLAQRVGGLSGLRRRVSQHFGKSTEAADRESIETREISWGVEPADDSPEAQLEERVLEAFYNDPVLGERPVDIGALGEGIVELTGHVYSADEVEHAVTVTRGVPGVSTVVNRLAVQDEETALEQFRPERYLNGDPSLSQAHWEGQHVGTGQRRQGISTEFDRHADPKPELEDRWLGADAAIKEAADETVVSAGQRQKAKKAARGGRTDGSPISPTGVPKADHVADASAFDPPI